MPGEVWTVAQALADGLFTGSLEGAFFIAVVWLVCRRVPHVPASIQAALWWLASLKLVLAVLPVPEISLPLLPAVPVAQVLPVAEPVAVQPIGPIAIQSPGGVPWLPIVVAIWLVGVLMLAIRLVLAFGDLRGIARRAVALSEEESRIAQNAAKSIGLSAIPEIRVSQEIAAPLVAGVWRPIVLVPAESRFESDELRMALCHELMHVRRRDLASGWIPAVAERLFFFHPLARLAAREYVIAREAACDAAVVRALGVSPDLYGRLLVRLGFARSEPAFAAGGAPASMSSLRRRLDMLQQPAITKTHRRLSLLFVAAAFLALVPFQLSATTPTPQRPSESNADSHEQARVVVLLDDSASMTTLDQAAAREQAPAETTTSREQPTTGPSFNILAMIEAIAGHSKRQRLERIENFLDPAQIETFARAERQVNDSDVERQYRQAIIDAEEAFRTAQDTFRRALENENEAAQEARRRALLDGEQAVRLAQEAYRRKLETEYGAARTDAARAAREAADQLRSAAADGDARQALLDALRNLESQTETERRARERIIAAEQALVVQRRQSQAQVEQLTRAQNEALTAQLEVLRKQQQELLQQLQEIVQQQKTLAEAQRLIAAETERIREALKQR
jgi:beta-lactamase regulating signal transducer with metallopeptidase domain